MLINLIKINLYKRGANMKLFSRKKGSLNLSINAIVVLILAITMLGLGLGFMRNMFKKTTSSFDDVAEDLKNEMISEIESGNERLIFNKYDVSMKKSSSKTLYFGVKNDLRDSATFTLLNDNAPAITNVGEYTPDADDASQISCYDAIDTSSGISGENADTDHIQFKTLTARQLEVSQVAVLKLEVEATSSAIPTTYSCSMIIADPTSAPDFQVYDRKDFFITIES
jgi:hypothetical protein